MTKAAHLTRLAWIAALLLLAGCASDPPARRSNVAPPSIEMAAPRLEVAPGSRVAIVARTHGGEAILFTVDWAVVEGAGQVQAGRRSDDGSYEATYTAPATRGTYHVTATIREFPSATATAEVRVR
jgi:hypothetical protein